MLFGCNNLPDYIEPFNNIQRKYAYRNYVCDKLITNTAMIVMVLLKYIAKTFLYAVKIAYRDHTKDKTNVN